LKFGYYPSSCDGHESAAVGYLACGLLITELEFGATSLTLGAGNEAWRSGRKGTSKTADPCCKLGSIVCNWRLCPGKFDCSSGSSSKLGGTFRSGLDWATLACISPWSFSIWVSRLQFSSFSSFFSMVTCPRNAIMWNQKRNKATVWHYINLSILKIWWNGNLLKDLAEVLSKYKVFPVIHMLFNTLKRVKMKEEKESPSYIMRFRQQCDILFLEGLDLRE